MDIEAVNKNTRNVQCLCSMAYVYTLCYTESALSTRLEACMWHLWRLRPRPLWPPWRWPWRYYAWRLETYTGIPASEVTWHTFLTFFRQPQHRRAFWRYVRWLRQMRRLRHLERR